MARARQGDGGWAHKMLAGLHTGPHCIPLLPDPRGPGWLLAGVCVDCGRVTARRRLADGLAHCRGVLGEFAVRPRPQ